MSSAGIVVRTWRKWRTAEAVQQAETRLKHKAILGTVAQGRAGHGSLKKPDTTLLAERRGRGWYRCKLQ